MAAAISASLDISRYLIERGADVNIADHVTNLFILNNIVIIKISQVTFVNSIF